MKYLYDEHVYEDKLQLITLLWTLPEAQEFVKNIRKRYQIPNEGFETFLESKKWEETNEELVAFKKECLIFLNRCKGLRIDTRLANSIEKYITRGIIEAPRTNFLISYDKEELHGGYNFKVTYYGIPTPKEEKAIRAYLKSMMKQYDPLHAQRSTPKEDFDQDLKILKLSKKLGNIIEYGTEPGSYYEYNLDALSAELSPIDLTEEEPLSEAEEKKRTESIRKKIERRRKEIETRIGLDNK